MARNKTNEEFLKEVHDLVGNEYSILSEYKKAKIKVKIKHNKCGYEYEVRPNDFLNGRRCPKCSLEQKSRKKTKTTEQFKDEVHNLVGADYIVLGKYKNSRTKIKMKHSVCGYEYEVEANAFLQGKRCPKCRGNFRKTTEQFKDEVHDLVGDEYTVLSEYKNNHTKILMRHNKCDYIYKIFPKDLICGSRCPNCYGTLKKTTQQFKDEVYKLVGNEYSVLSEYVNNKTKIKMKHNKCGTYYEVTPHNFLQGYRCPNCANDYKGENLIKEYLDNHGIKYDKEKTFPWLKYKANGNQRLDFYLPDYNLAIEYDGEQHFQTVRHSKKDTQQELEDNLKLNQLRDKNKNKLCYQHDIKVLRIPYWKKNSIKSILNKKLTK